MISGCFQVQMTLLQIPMRLTAKKFCYAVSKAKGTPPPAPGKITIAVKGDPNVTALTKTSIEADH
ncbi:hypothetical protein TPHV1_90012 [Treponema phagedenis]|uniref:Uncharacterized protein n=1 Tax=Treponema phagedenis TaxID=162 RepID=A0A0B7GXZ0_TREPH|nr:hypothetical protein TPHV1_90012 [Treponema phagedenis]